MVTPIVGTLLWSAGIVAVCTAPMVIGYRKASMCTGDLPADANHEWCLALESNFCPMWSANGATNAPTRAFRTGRC